MEVYTLSRHRHCDGSVSDTFSWVSDSTLSQVFLPMFLFVAINRGLNMHFKRSKYLKMLSLNRFFFTIPHPRLFPEVHDLKKNNTKKGFIMKPQEYPSSKCIFPFRWRMLMYISETDLSVCFSYTLHIRTFYISYMQCRLCNME